MSLPPALAPLGQYRQWITYATSIDPSTGKLDKTPTDWRTGHTADPHDPSIWTDYATAYAHGKPGFVLTDQDPFVCIDLDNCREGDTWSKWSQEICALFPGAAIEVSVSGNGLHIWCIGAVPEHGSKGRGVEMYHRARFVALGHNAQGNALTDCSAGMSALLVKCPELAPRKGAPGSKEWTTEPCAEWNGPTDDDELLRRALASKSSSSAFGHRASFQQLWDAEVPALMLAYPQGAGYDESSADAALAQHLAFWTGKHCERILRLMQRSNLKRSKWQTHASYLERTITQAVAQQVDVLQDKPLQPLDAPIVSAEDVKGETSLSLEQMKVVFQGCVYVSEAHAVLVPNGTLLAEGRFNARYGGYTMMHDYRNSKLAKTAWQAFTCSKDVRFPQVDSMEFDPTRDPGAVWTQGNRTYVNTYVPAKVRLLDGNFRPFQDHLARILPDPHDRAILLAYMAAVVQHPGVKFQWAPVIQGPPGNGKTLLSRCVAEAIGREYCHIPRPKDLDNKFNAWMLGKILICIEDIKSKEYSGAVLETLESLITSEYLEIEGKGGNQSTHMVCANFMINTNFKDGISKRKDDRRFAPFYTRQQSVADIERDGMGGDYFPKLYTWLKGGGYSVVAKMLHDYKIPDELNPATKCIRAPMTSSTREAIDSASGVMENEIKNAIETDKVGFREGWVSSYFVDQLIGMQLPAIQAKWPRNKRKELLLDLGYQPHPDLPKGQVHNAVAPDGIKSTLYVPMMGHKSLGLRPAEIARMYSDDQINMTAALRAVGT